MIEGHIADARRVLMIAALTTLPRMEIAADKRGPVNHELESVRPKHAQVILCTTVRRPKNKDAIMLTMLTMAKFPKFGGRRRTVIGRGGVGATTGFVFYSPLPRKEVQVCCLLKAIIVLQDRFILLHRNV